MSVLKNLSPGKNIPNDVNVIIEIPANGGSLKYEFDKEHGLLAVDRFMTTSMHYPCNYGFVPNTLSNDGDPVDVLVITPEPVHPGSLIRVRMIGMLNMTDEAGEDTKLIAVPIEKICLQLAYVKTLDDIPAIELAKIKHFFEHYKELEPNKWVKVEGFANVDAAAKEINDSIKRFEQSHETKIDYA